MIKSSNSIYAPEAAMEQEVLARRGSVGLEDNDAHDGVHIAD